MAVDEPQLINTFNHLDQKRNESFTDVFESFTACYDAHHTRFVGRIDMQRLSKTHELYLTSWL